MATKTRIIGWNPNAFLKEVTDNAIALQNQRLVEYAVKEVESLGKKILSYNYSNNLDRTGNLLNSVCWGVYYNGKRKGYGFYRDPILRDKGIYGTSESYLHEFFGGTEDVDGRQRAEDFLNSYKPTNKGWRVIFAILAPYWGYWESGFMMRGGGGVYSWQAPKKLVGKKVTPRFNAGFKQFQVMTHVFDEVRTELKPAETHLTVYVPKYSHNARSIKGKKYANSKFVPKI